MKRRDFLKLIGVACVAPSLPEPKTGFVPVSEYKNTSVLETEFGTTFSWRKYVPLKASTTPLCEGITPNMNSLKREWVTAK